MAARTASKQKPALGRLPMPTYINMFAGIPFSRQIIIISPHFPQYGDGTAENLCQPLVAVFNSLLFVESRLSRSPIELSFRPGNASKHVDVGRHGEPTESRL